MVLDPLSAFSLACNVLQVIEVACKTLSTAADYRSSSDGSLKEQKELRDNFRSLNGLSTGLQSLLTSSPGSNQPSQEETRLNEANNECLRLSKDFLDFLDRLKVKDRHSTLESLRMSIKARWYKDRMDVMQQAISQARDNLNIAFLLYMHSQQVLASTQIKGKIDELGVNLEQGIISAISSSSLSIQEDVRRLAEQLKDSYLDADDQTATGFANTHQDVLSDIASQLRAISISQANVQAAKAEDRDLIAQQGILDSLYFIQMGDRQEHVARAYSSTYEWILKPKIANWLRWDCFSTWINEPVCAKRLYWIYGKPGSGKSTLMKYLNNTLDADLHMRLWAGTRPVLIARCFFWTAGNPLQKSLRGLYRTLLYHLMEQCPEMIGKIVSPRRWRAATLRGNVGIEWTESELRNALTSLTEQLQARTKILFLIDGLDEFDGSEQELDDLIDYVLHLSNFENVKVCVASRPLNVFKDAFGSHPQLKLEDLTRWDIQTYTKQQLENSRRWQYYVQTNQASTTSLVEDVINKASGVFLWVRLVVHDILQGLRDGDSLSQLNKKLEEIPADLDHYFFSIIGTIETKHQREASVLLQLALHQEDQFENLSPLSVLDIFFVEEEDEGFVVQPGFDLSCLDFSDTENLTFRIDSAIRKLNSRCKGLLEIVERYDSTSDSLMLGGNGSERPNDSVAVNAMSDSSVHRLSLNELLVREGITRTGRAYDIFTLRIEFLHRSLRDFLLGNEMQKFLHKHTQGPVDARLFLCSARVVQVHALTRNGTSSERAVRISSFLMTALSVYRETKLSIKMAPLLADAMSVLGTNYNYNNGALYVECALRSWNHEKSTFLTLAIDFNLTSYVLHHLSSHDIRTKSGRPILDYILRPRFVEATYLRVNNRWPQKELLEAALNRGAHPNQMYEDEGVSVWALFLCWLRDTFAAVQPAQIDAYLQKFQTAAYEALQLMVNSGAHLYLIQSAISMDASYDNYFHTRQGQHLTNRHRRLKRRWPDLKPYRVDNEHKYNNLYRVSDMLQIMRPGFDFSIDPLIEDVKTRERSHPYNTT